MPNPPPDRFDPCRAWLGIDRADLADPRRVLGILPAESDPIVVLKAAETRLKALKGLAAGQHHAAREALILQVEQARERVLSQIASGPGGGGTDRPAASGSGFAMPPPPRRPEVEGPATVLIEEPGQTHPTAEGTPIVRVRPRRPIRRQGHAAIWVSLLAMVASVAAGVAFIWWQARQEDLRQAARNQVAKRSTEEGASADDRPLPAAQPLPEDVAISSSPPPTRSTSMKKPVASPVPKPSLSPRVSTPSEKAAAEPTDIAMGDRPSDDSPPTGTAMEDQPEPDVAAPPGESAPEAPADGAMDDEPATDEPPAEEVPTDDDVDGAIEQALAAIREGDFDTADALLASALEGGRSVAAKRRVSDWQTLAQYAREFAGFREKAIAEVTPGNEFDVNGKKVAVVELDDKKFIYRFQGRNKTTPRNKIPSAIALAIVTTWFDERPANHLFLGAHHATKGEPDLAKARDHWERAEKGGINAEPLLRLLEDRALQEGPGAAEPTDE